MGWQAALALEEGDAPAWLRLADRVVAEIERGRLRPGDALPGTRRVADQLGLHRNTVLRAWGELDRQGWITSRPGAATRVASLPPRPAAPPTTRGADPEPPFFVPEPLPPTPEWPTGVGTLSGGRPELRHLPVAELARAWRAAVRRSRARVLEYGPPEGHPRLREALRAMLAAERGLAVGPPLVTRGAQHAVYLLAHALLRPGDRVAVEALGYPPAWAALRSAGAELVPVQVDELGLVPESLERAAAAGIRALYCTPHHQYPTMVTLPASRRLAVLDLAVRHGFAVIEDDYDNEFHYTGRPVLPLAALDRAGSVLYVGTLSKVLAPGLRLGFLAGAPRVLEAVARLRRIVDRQGDAATEVAVADLVEDGTVPRHLRRMRRIYAARQAHFAAALRERLGEAITFDVPSGGLSMWIGSRPDVRAWAARALDLGLGLEVGSRFHLAGAQLQTFRAGFASMDEAELDHAVELLYRSMPLAGYARGVAEPRKALFDYSRGGT